jgi:hypothetical protein
VLVVDTVFDALEVAGHLVDAGLPVAASKNVRDAAQRVRAHASVPALRASGREIAPLVRLDADKVKLADGARAVTAVVSYRVADGAVAGEPHDAAFAWPFVASHEQLLGWIEQSRAKSIFVTGVHADAMVAELGPRARVLGPPQQMALFGS